MSVGDTKRDGYIYMRQQRPLLLVVGGDCDTKLVSGLCVRCKELYGEMEARRGPVPVLLWVLTLLVGS